MRASVSVDVRFCQGAWHAMCMLHAACARRRPYGAAQARAACVPVWMLVLVGGLTWQGRANTGGYLGVHHVCPVRTDHDRGDAPHHGLDDRCCPVLDRARQPESPALPIAGGGVDGPWDPRSPVGYDAYCRDHHAHWCLRVDRRAGVQAVQGRQDSAPLASLLRDCPSVGVPRQRDHHFADLPGHLQAMQACQHGPPTLPNLRGHLLQPWRHGHHDWGPPEHYHRCSLYLVSVMLGAPILVSARRLHLVWRAEWRGRGQCPFVVSLICPHAPRFNCAGVAKSVGIHRRWQKCRLSSVAQTHTNANAHTGEHQATCWPSTSTLTRSSSTWARVCSWRRRPSSTSLYTTSKTT
jgi:hypothetical protein